MIAVASWPRFGWGLNSRAEFHPWRFPEEALYLLDIKFYDRIVI
jgi:hypothetical protein